MTALRPRWNLAGRAWLPWGLALLALLVRLYRLQAPSLWVDELFTLQAVRTAREIDPGFLLRDLHGPLYTALCALFGGVLSGEGLRLVSALAGALTVPFVHAWARRAAGDGEAALAALLMAISPFAVWYGQELRNYSLVLLLASATFLVLERWRGDDPGWRGFAGFVLAAWLGLLANLTFLLFLVGSGLALLAGARGRRRRTLGWLALATVSVLLLSLPWIHSFAVQMQPQRLVVDMPGWEEPPLRGETTFSLVALPYTLYALTWGFSLGPSLAEIHWGPRQSLMAHAPLVGILGLLAVGLLLRGWLRSEGRRFEWLLLVAVVLGLASFLAIKNFKVYNVRYVCMVLPLLLLLVSRGLLSLSWRSVRIGATVAVLALFTVSLGHHYWHPAYAKEDSRAAARRMEALAGPQDLVVVAVIGAPFAHYYRGGAPVSNLWPGEGAVQVAAKLEAWGHPEAFWLVSAREWEWGPPGSLAALFPEYRTARREQAGGIGIQRMTKQP
ncbi:MAG: glycosyltransferase family 39 protein [Candidatus Krumholzibacteriota bacterium]|nr:glycosyltransferase family 39 protein [Candidatus Krumholzibacteriota bacterium]